MSLEPKFARTIQERIERADERHAANWNVLDDNRTPRNFGKVAMSGTVHFGLELIEMGYEFITDFKNFVLRKN